MDPRVKPAGDSARVAGPRGTRAAFMSKKPADPNRLVAVTLDEESIGRSGPDIEHERAIAIYDLVEKNLFAPEGGHSGPFTLHIGITGNRLMFDTQGEA